LPVAGLKFACNQPILEVPGFATGSLGFAGTIERRNRSNSAGHLFEDVFHTQIGTPSHVRSSSGTGVASHRALASRNGTAFGVVERSCPDCRSAGR
jgi:hypothetical protein